MYSRYVATRLLSLSNRRCTEQSTRGCTFRRQFGAFRCGCKSSAWLREHGIQLARACARQFEFIAAQRVRRTIQLFQLYSSIWDEVALKEFFKFWKRRLANGARELVVAAIGVSAYNWDQQRIEDRELYSYSQEIEDIHKLFDSTIVCSNCHLRLIVDVAQKNVQYCQCPKSKCALEKAQEEGVEWLPFIERQDMLVWRKEEKDYGGQYAYKVYGSFNDVSAEDLLQVQIDIDYRKEWDVTAKRLEIIDIDPTLKNTVGSQTEVVYWEMIWPRFFTNRDYVYERRWLYDKEKGVIIIINKGVDHPNAPDRQDTHRVATYWSCMVIKPYTSIDKPGIEFGLTYFEDPGISIPSAVTSWVAMSGLPDYLYRMREAGKNYKNYKASQESESLIPKSILIMSSQDNEDKTAVYNEQKSEQNINESGPEVVKQDDTVEQILETTNDNTASKDDKVEEKEESNDTDSIPEDRGFLDYFYTAKLFA